MCGGVAKPEYKLAFQQWMKTPFAMCMISASMALDTFLVIGGLLTVYTYLRKRDYGAKFSVFLYYMHRFVR